MLGVNSDLDRALLTLTQKLIDTEETISSQFELLSSRVTQCFETSLNGQSVYEDPCTEISMGEVVPQELYTCTSSILLNDWVRNEAQYKRMFEEP